MPEPVAFDAVAGGVAALAPVAAGLAAEVAAPGIVLPVLAAGTVPAGVDLAAALACAAAARFCAACCAAAWCASLAASAFCWAGVSGIGAVVCAVAVTTPASAIKINETRLSRRTRHNFE